jgi:hypothetical protein
VTVYGYQTATDCTGNPAATWPLKPDEPETCLWLVYNESPVSMGSFWVPVLSGGGLGIDWGYIASSDSACKTGLSLGPTILSDGSWCYEGPFAAMTAVNSPLSLQDFAKFGFQTIDDDLRIWVLDTARRGIVEALQYRYGTRPYRFKLPFRISLRATARSSNFLHSEGQKFQVVLTRYYPRSLPFRMTNVSDGGATKNTR